MAHIAPNLTKIGAPESRRRDASNRDGFEAAFKNSKNWTTTTTTTTTTNYELRTTNYELLSTKY